MPIERDLVPGAKWVFDGAVAKNFEDMLERSIPDYRSMRARTFEVAMPFVQPFSMVYDLGCSRGSALAPFIEKVSTAHNIGFCGYDESHEMVEACRERYAGNKYVTAKVCDLRRESVPIDNASLVLCVLTLQFLPIEKRQGILESCFNGMKRGGAFILVEKVIGDTAGAQRLLVDRYHEMKERNGYSRAEIDAKSKALEGVLVPLKSRWNEGLLCDAGFDHVECFWRSLNFAAWVGVR